jgi:hypothetical protein
LVRELARHVVVVLRDGIPPLLEVAFQEFSLPSKLALTAARTIDVPAVVFQKFHQISYFPATSNRHQGDRVMIFLRRL